MTNVNVTLKPANGIRVVLVPPDETEVTLNRMYLYDKTVTDKAKEWAIKMDGMVQEDGVDVDYSSKYYATESKNSETLAQGYAESASTSAGSASESATLAEGYSITANQSAQAARYESQRAEGWATEAGHEAATASEKAIDAGSYADIARDASNWARQYAQSASNSMEASRSQADRAYASATGASGYADTAKQWAIGDPSEPSGGSAKYWAQQVENAIPDQTGQSGKYLTTNGSTTSWSTVDALPSQTGNNGKFLKTNGTTASWTSISQLPSQSGHSGQFLKTNGSSASWATITIPVVDQTYDGTSANAQSGVAVKSAIDTAISSVYKPAGSSTFANLPSLSSSIEGYVYNVSDAFTTTSDFVEGAGKSYPAGTNIVCIDIGSYVYKWDVLSGIVDLSGYEKTSNKVTSVSSSSTDTQYPSAKCLYDTSDELLNMIIAEGNLRSDVDDQLNDEINNMTEYLDASVKTTETIPITDYRLLNIPVQYKGATTQDYINGYFYKFTDPVYSSSVTIQTGSFTVTVNNSTFISKANKTGRYFFRKYGTYWYSDLGSISPSSLSSYGITITGTVNTGDKFYIDLSMVTTVTRIDVQPSNAGTVTSVNNVQPVNGNVTLTASNVGALPDNTVIPTDTSDLTNGAGYITSSALSGYATQTWVGQQGYLTSTALSGYATEQWVGQQGYITGITSSMVTTALGYTPYNGSVMTGADGTSAGTSGLVPAPSATDNTKYLRGDGTWQTVSGGGSYSAGTGIDITNNTISVTSPTLTNTATGTGCLAILGSISASYLTNSTVIGYGASSNVSSATVLGNSASVTSAGGVALGRNAVVSGSYGIQLGYGKNSEANSFYVGTSTSNNWKLLGSDGKIPDGRLPIATSVSSSSTNADVVGAKLFYDTCGDIETLINAL